MFSGGMGKEIGRDWIEDRGQAMFSGGMGKEIGRDWGQAGRLEIGWRLGTSHLEIGDKPFVSTQGSNRDRVSARGEGRSIQVELLDTRITQGSTTCLRRMRVQKVASAHLHTVRQELRRASLASSITECSAERAGRLQPALAATGRFLLQVLDGARSSLETSAEIAHRITPSRRVDANPR